MSRERENRRVEDGQGKPLKKVTPEMHREGWAGLSQGEVART